MKDMKSIKRLKNRNKDEEEFIGRDHNPLTQQET